MVSMSLLSKATGWISSAAAYPRGTPAVANNAAPMERKALAEGETAVIILVGTTGSGKSTLANLLVDPAQDENLQVEHFRTSERAKACTTLVKSQEFVSDGQKYLVVDTPGFDETDEADKQHVKELLEALVLKHKRISAVVYVHNKAHRVEEAARRLLGYVGRLFGDVMSQNFMVMVTNSPQDPSEWRYQTTYRQPGAQQKYRNEIRHIVAGQLQLEDHAIHVSDIDSLPAPGLPRELAARLRQQFLREVAARPVVDVTKLRMPKLPGMIAEDVQAAAELQGKLDAKRAELEAAGSKEDQAALAQIWAQKERIGQMTKEITRVTQKIEMFDSDTLESVGFDSGYRGRFEDTPLILRASSKSRHKITDFRVTLPAKHKEDKYKTDLQEHDLIVTIHPDSGYFGTTQAEATVFSTKRIINAEALTILRENVAVFEQQRAAAEVACDNIRASSEAARQAFSDALKAEIEDIQAEQARLLEEYIDVQEEFERNYADAN